MGANHAADVERQADMDLYHHYLNAGDYYFLFHSHPMGNSSQRARVIPV